MEGWATASQPSTCTVRRHASSCMAHQLLSISCTGQVPGQVPAFIACASHVLGLTIIPHLMGGRTLETPACRQRRRWCLVIWPDCQP